MQVLSLSYNQEGHEFNSWSWWFRRIVTSLQARRSWVRFLIRSWNFFILHT
jgi:hypothetical protein